MGICFKWFVRPLRNWRRLSDARRPLSHFFAAPIRPIVIWPTCFPQRRSTTDIGRSEFLPSRILPSFPGFFYRVFRVPSPNFQGFSWFYLVLTEFWVVELGCTEKGILADMILSILPDFTGFYRILPGFTGFSGSPPLISKFFLVLSNLYRVLGSWENWVVLKRESWLMRWSSVLSSLTGFNRVLPNFTEFYRVFGRARHILRAWRRNEWRNNGRIRRSLEWWQWSDCTRAFLVGPRRFGDPLPPPRPPCFII